MPKKRFSPRFTTSLSPEMRDAVVAWGAARGMVVPAEIVRAMITVALQAPGTAVDVVAFAVAREQRLAELRQETRAALVAAAATIRRR